MRYSLWVNVLKDKYIHYAQATNIEILQDLAREVVLGSYIYDHVRHIKLWQRDADGTEVYDNLMKEV